MLIYLLHPLLQFFMLFNNINVRFSQSWLHDNNNNDGMCRRTRLFITCSFIHSHCTAIYILKHILFIHSFIHDGTRRIWWIGCIVIFIVHQVCNIPQGYFPQHNTIKSLCNAKNAKFGQNHTTALFSKLQGLSFPFHFHYHHINKQKTSQSVAKSSVVTMHHSFSVQLL